MLPIHYRTYLAEVACKKAAATNVETVFSGAGKFSAEVCRGNASGGRVGGRRGGRCDQVVWRLSAGTHICGAHGQAPSMGPLLLPRIVRLHYNWKYLFLRPTILEIIERYNAKFRPTKNL